MAKRVGVVGLGIMGGAFAENLIRAGWHVAGFDIDPARCRLMAKRGVEITPDAKILAGKAQIVITSLPKPAALAETTRAILDANVRRRILVEASTFSIADKVSAARALAKGGHVMLDCPVSGTGKQAAVKDLVIYASGDRKTIRKLHPLFAGFSRAAHDLGTFGNGSRMKYIANLLVAINNVASAEAIVLGIKAGLDPATVFEMVASGAGNSRVFELRAPLMVKDRYDDPSMKVSVWQKDMSVIGAFARGLGSPTPLFDATVPIYDRAMKTGHADEDTAAVCAVLEQMAGVKRARGKRRRKR